MNNLKAEKEKAYEKVCGLICGDKQALWKQDFALFGDQTFPNVLEIMAEFFAEIKAPKFEICAASHTLNLKQIAEMTSEISFEKYLSEDEARNFFELGAFFREQLVSLQNSALKKGIAREGNIYDEVCLLQKAAGRNVFVLTADNIAMQGKIKIELDKLHNVHHAIKLNGISFPLMEVKCVAESKNMSPIFYNDFLNDLPPKTAYIKKFGEQVEFALWQESDMSERSRKF